MKKAIELLEEAKKYIGKSFYASSPIKSIDKYETVNNVKKAEGCISEALAELKFPPRWETPEQWEKRTGDKYPDRAPVWCADNDNPADPWFLDYYENAVDDERCYIICAVGGCVPPNNWRPEDAE